MPRLNRRKFIQYSTSTTIASLGATGVVTADDEEDAPDFGEVDDLGNPIDGETTASAGPSTALEVDSDDSVNPTDPPDATIEASEFEWISVEPDEFGDDTTALRLSDDGGVNFNFLYETDGDLTVDAIWRHHSGGGLAYLFNDLDSIRFGFRAFTNGIAGNGLFFRNPFGGSDIFVSDDFQDGEWYQIRIVLDADENSYTVFINGEEIAQAFYDGSGFVTSEDFRIMGRKTGSSTLIDYRFYAWANRAVLPGDADRVDSELLQLELDEGEGDSLENVSGVAVESITEPPTGVRPDEPVRLSVTVSGQGVTPDDVFVSATSTVSAADGIDWLGFHTFDASTEITETSAGALEIDIEFPSTEEIPRDTPEGGLCYESSVTVEVDGEELLDEEWNTYTFEQVDTVATVLAHSNGRTQALTGDELYRDLRQTAEFVCEYYASTMGSKGAHGFAFDFVTRGVDDGYGWLELDSPRTVYDDGGGRPDNSLQFVQDALDRAAEELAVIFDDYTTAFVLNDTQLSRPFYQGEVWPDAVDYVPIPLGGFVVLVPAELLTDRFPISPYNTPTGRIDAAYDGIHDRTWRHELGHSLGPNEQVGLPDLYDMTVGNLGTIGGWGLMGSPSSTGPITSYCQVLGGDFFDRNEWLQEDRNYHFLTDTDLELTPLTEQQLGDDAVYLTSVFGEFTISVDYPSWSDPITKPSVSFSPENFHLTTYILEARRGADAPIVDPRLLEDGDEPSDGYIERSPSDDDGLALYKFGLFNVDGRAELERILDFENPIEIDDVTPIDLNYVPPETGDEDEPTLSLDKSSTYETYEDEDTVTTFELTESVSSGSPQVHVERDPESLVGGAAKYVARIIGEVVDFFEDIADDVDAITCGSEPLPGLDVLVETPDGLRAGTDPRTGERYEEIPGSRVGGTRNRRIVSVPGDVDFEVTISADRLRCALEDRGIEPPEEIPYKRTLVVDRDPTFRDDDGIPVLEGRTRQTVRTTTGADLDVDLLTGVVAEVDPDRINVDASGEFVTAYLTFDADVDPETLVVESVAMEQVRAVHADSYGFVEDPVVTLDGETAAQVKFDRQAVVGAFEVGEQDVLLTGVIDGATFQAETTIELFEPGNSRGESQNN